MNPVITDAGEVPAGKRATGGGVRPERQPHRRPDAGKPGPRRHGRSAVEAHPGRDRAEVDGVVRRPGCRSWRAAWLSLRWRPRSSVTASGANADAIVPFLQGEDARLRGASVHSTVMRMLVELGVPGLLIYLALIAVTIWLCRPAVWRVPNAVVLPLVGIVGASLAHQLFGTLLLGGLTYGSYVFVVALGLLTASVARHRRVHPGTEARRTQHRSAA